MFTRILSPLAAEPILGLGLNKIARTPRPRLAVGYRLEPKAACNSASTCDLAARARAPQPNARAYVEFLAQSWSHAQLQLTRTLGASLFLDRVIAGGVVGEVLPLATLRCRENNNPLIGPPGALIDAIA